MKGKMAMKNQMQFVFVSTVTLMAFVLGCVFWPVMAFAQAADPSQAGLDTGVLQTFWGFVKTGHYGAALAPGLVIAVWILRKYDAQIPKYGAQIDAFFNQPLVAFALPSILSAVAGAGTALATGHPISQAFEPAIEAAGAAIVSYVGLKKTQEQWKAAMGPALAPPANPPPVIALAPPPADVPPPKPTAPGGGAP